MHRRILVFTLLLTLNVHSRKHKGKSSNNNYESMTSNIKQDELARLDQIRKQFMYPYHDTGSENNTNGDYQKEIKASKPLLQKKLPFNLPFFGFRYNYIRVSLNGYLAFSDFPKHYKYPLVFPSREWPKTNDPAFIGIFLSKCRIGKLRKADLDKRTPGVYLRIEENLRIRQDQVGVELRERLTWDIREGIIGAETFDPKHAVIATWKNVSFSGGVDAALHKTNTFQMIVATDEIYTYTIFNYEHLDWTSHTNAGGDAENGEGGVPAFVGFNAGNGTRSWEYAPYSQQSFIRDLASTGFVNGHKGRHIFRIDENILLGSCNNEIDGANLPLLLAPESGNMLGGTIVNITGPCFKPNDKIRCRFHTADPVPGYVVDRNRAICVQPHLFVEGYVTLGIQVNGGRVHWKGKYYVESPSRAAQKIFIDLVDPYEISPNLIKILWQKNNLTTNQDVDLSISLWGYKETDNKPEIMYISTIAENIANTGEYTIIPSQYRNRTDQLIGVQFGFLQINLTEPIQISTNACLTKDIEIRPVIWSRPMPLGWYFQFQWETLYGRNWPERLCDAWLSSDRNFGNFTHELPECPCTLEQALADKGQFMPDPQCDKDSACPLYNHALHCVISGLPTVNGAQQQCCYDRNAYLILSHDVHWGSSPSRSHNLGQTPYDKASKVPTLSHWYHDVMPKYMCCLWQGERAEGCEDLRLERRPTQDCVAYQGPGIAGVYGDPHFITFDDVEYTFNGKGEFVLVKSLTAFDNLDVQGRFEQMPDNAYGKIKATTLTSVVARGNSSTVIEVRSRPLDAGWRYKLDVIADGRRIYFDRPALKLQHFPGVTVYTPTYNFNQSEVIIMFDNGAGVEVLQNHGSMSARVYLPRTFINKTVGLFGSWNFHKDDDFTLPDGTNTNISYGPSRTKQIFRHFGSEWRLDGIGPYKGKALFQYEFGRSSLTYNDKRFKPQLLLLPEEIIAPNRSVHIARAYELCGSSNTECLYDFVMTLNKNFAKYTHIYKETIYNLKRVAGYKVVSCGPLRTPRFGRKSNFLFVPGTKVVFDCDVGFVLMGDNKRSCQANGTWSLSHYNITTTCVPSLL